MAIGLEAKGYRESETRAGKRHRNRQKVAKRDERAQELSHKAILPREIYYTLTNIKGIEKEIGVIKKEKSKLRHILGIEHGNIPIQLDL
jgi:hypothetical protein